MAILRRGKRGIWHYSVYVPGRPTRLRGSTGTTNRAEALLIEQTMHVASRSRAPLDHAVKILEALFGVSAKPEEIPDIPLEAVEEDTARIAADMGKPPTRGVSISRHTAMRRLIAWRDAARPDITGARKVDRAAAMAFSASLRREGMTDKGRANLIGDLGTMWNILARGHDGIENQWPKARPMHVGQNVREPFTRKEVLRLFDAADGFGHGWGLACRIAAATGLRYGDVARLRHGDIRDGVLRVMPHKTSAHGVAVEMPLPPDILAAIGKGDPEAFVLPEHGEKYGRSKDVGRLHPFSEVMRLAGVEPRGRTFHSFRHYFRTQLAAAGVSDETAMRLGGWTQRSTAARYDHDAHREEAGRAVAAAWARLRQPSGG